jgi:GNAT superfamily N-acetyltransferase
VSFLVRTASLEDVPSLETLIGISARSLARPFYSNDQIEAALESAWGVDTQLIRDGTFFIAESAGKCAGCGGWSYRGTLFGADNLPGREAAILDPDKDAARIRAFFVHPDFARIGIGQNLLQRSEGAAREKGFRAAELVATLPGEPFYRKNGYKQVERLQHPLRPGLTIEFVKMRKERI